MMAVRLLLAKLAMMSTSSASPSLYLSRSRSFSALCACLRSLFGFLRILDWYCCDGGCEVCLFLWLRSFLEVDGDERSSLVICVYMCFF